MRLLIALVLTLLTASHAQAATGISAAYCRRVGTDDRAQPVPANLVAAFQRAFDLHAPTDYVIHTSSLRCANGVLLGCTTGANLPCGKADTRRDIPGADAWCRDKHDPSMIPAYVTGHASIYAWRCEDARAVPVRQVQQVDPRGFVAQYLAAVGAMIIDG